MSGYPLEGPRACKFGGAGVHCHSATLTKLPEPKLPQSIENLIKLGTDSKAIISLDSELYLRDKYPGSQPARIKQSDRTTVRNFQV